MDARPLRDLLADLVGDSEARRAYGADPAGYLAAHGHPDLPEPLLAEAVVSYADTAPVEVASALAPYVAAHGPVPDPDAAPADWFDLLTSSDPADDPFGEHAADVPDQPEDWTDPGELDFGTGATAPAEPTAESTVDEDAHDDVPDASDAPEPAWTADPQFTPEPPIEGLADEDDEDADELD